MLWGSRNRGLKCCPSHSEAVALNFNCFAHVKCQGVAMTINSSVLIFSNSPYTFTIWSPGCFSYDREGEKETSEVTDRFADCHIIMCTKVCLRVCLLCDQTRTLLVSYLVGALSSVMHAHCLPSDGSWCHSPG